MHKTSRKPTYDLYAVINHSGTLTSGHYTAYGKNRDDLHWYHFNDSLVTPVQQPESLNDAYLLFYFKNSVEEFKRQTLEGINVSQKERQQKYNSNQANNAQYAFLIIQQQSVRLQKKQQQQFSTLCFKSSLKMLFRKQTKHFQIVKASEQPSFQQESYVIQEEN